MANYGYTPGAYNPYNPAPSYGYPSPFNTPYNTGYTPALTGQQPAPQQPQNAQQVQSNVPWIQVPNIEAARNVMVQPNQTAYMMNQNAPEFYVKATDGMGVASLRCFKFAEFNPTEEAAKEVINSQASNFISREEFNQFANGIVSQINEIQLGVGGVGRLPLRQHVEQPVQQVVPQVVQQVQTEPAPAPVVTPAPVRGVSKKKETSNDGQ